MIEHIGKRTFITPYTQDDVRVLNAMIEKANESYKRGSEELIRNLVSVGIHAIEDVEDEFILDAYNNARDERDKIVATIEDEIATGGRATTKDFSKVDAAFDEIYNISEQFNEFMKKNNLEVTAYEGR